MNENKETVENMTKSKKKIRNERLLNELINAHDNFIIQSHNNLNDSFVSAAMALEHVERLISYRNEDIPGEKTLTNKLRSQFYELINKRDLTVDGIEDKEELKKRVKVFLIRAQKGNKHEQRNIDNRKYVETHKSGDTTGSKEKVNKED
jgi:hypothetical protein